eukprot:444956-Pleurochrysis_carterae.AAC.1
MLATPWPSELAWAAIPGVSSANSSVIRAELKHIPAKPAPAETQPTSAQATAQEAQSPAKSPMKHHADLSKSASGVICEPVRVEAARAAPRNAALAASTYALNRLFFSPF